LRLARWCQMSGLKERALSEAKAALEMRPEHTETLQLVQILQRLTISSTGLGSPPPPATPKAPAPKSVPRTPLDVSQESSVQFSAKVQPILLNACSGCHSAAKGTTFQLQRPADV